MHVPDALDAINSWWFAAPWTAYHLHWDDQQNWPDPWLLLSDNIFCSLARALGIVYTIGMLERADMQDTVLTEFQSDNLVLVNKTKYILNWDPNTIVNINPGPRGRHHCSLLQIQKRIV